MPTTPEARMAHWKRCIAERPKWPFHTPSRCTDPQSIAALHDHLAQEHGVAPHYLTGWYPEINTWEQLLQRHEDEHRSCGLDSHSHASIPDVSWL
ncbi:hypothetical protein [Actinomadura mexicana]|nr:hypothetical protein [Actinomadura mexicana]